MDSIENIKLFKRKEDIVKHLDYVLSTYKNAEDCQKSLIFQEIELYKDVLNFCSNYVKAVYIDGAYGEKRFKKRSVKK